MSERVTLMCSAYSSCVPVVAVLGSVLLVAVSLVRPGLRAKLWVFVAAMVLAPLLLTQAASAVLERPGGIFPESLNEQLLRSVTPVLASVADDPGRVVIVIEGASWSSRGIDGARLEMRLREQGIDADVVQVTLPAANHFERDYLLRTLSQSLESDQLDRLSDTKLMLLREISQDYLENPIAQVERNLYTDRVYAYAAPGRAWRMSRAARAANQLEPTLALQIGQHAAFNWLRIGEVSRLETPYADATRAGYWPLDTTEDDMHTRGISDILEFLDTTPVPSFDPPAAIDVLERVGDDGYGLPIDATVFYEMPNLSVRRSEYARWFASQSSSPTLAIEDTELYRRLDDVDLWYDTGHLRREGAEIFTDWLALQLADLLGHEA